MRIQNIAVSEQTTCICFAEHLCSIHNVHFTHTIAVSAAHPKRRPVRRPEADAPSREQNADDIASMSYVGGNIPSKCFRMLQQSVGEPEASE